LTLADLLILAFTTVWSYHYTRLAQQLAVPERRPSRHSLQRAAWIGVTAAAAGIVVSMLVTLFEVVQLLIYFLRAPQAGVPVIQTTAPGTATWVSAADMMSLMALILGMFGGLIFLVLSLWLLFRTVALVDPGDGEWVGNELRERRRILNGLNIVLTSSRRTEMMGSCPEVRFLLEVTPF
jgi:Protein of unknown function (DUF3611)